MSIRQTAIVLNKSANAAIIMSRDSSETERFAAKELSRHIRKMADVDLCIDSVVSQSQKPIRIFIGQKGWKYIPEWRNIKQDLTFDGFAIHVDDNNIAIMGICDRGTLNGVYQLLYELGCRWVFPGIDGEIISHFSTISLSKGTHCYNPDLEFRGACILPNCKKNIEQIRGLIDWMGKNRMNMLMTCVRNTGSLGLKNRWEEVGSELLPEIQKRDMILNMSEHSGRYFFPTSYFEDNPEWFAMDATGKRFSTGQICYSNKEAVKKLGDNFIAYVREHPEVHIIGTWPEDGYGFCQCEKCRQPGAVLKAVNKIAQRIEQVRPDITVEYLSYTKETSTVPEDILPHKNIAVLVANTSVAEDWLKKSENAGAHGVYCLHYHLADNIAERGNLPLRFEATSNDCRSAKNDGLRGIVPFYIGFDSWWRSSLNLYIFSQCLWDISKNAEILLDDYCKKYYGDAAHEMYTLFKSLEKEIPNIQTPVDWPLWQEWKELRIILCEENWKKLKKIIAKQRDLLFSARTKGIDSTITKRLDAVSSYIDFVESWLKAFHERALGAAAFEQKKHAKVREHIVEAAKQEKRMNELLKLSVNRCNGVNAPAPLFRFFQNKRLQLDKQLLEMREKKEKITDNDPDIMAFLPGILENNE